MALPHLFRAEDKPKAGLGCGFPKGKGSTKFLWEVDGKVGTFPPSQVRDAGIQAEAVASDTANSGYFHVFAHGCAAAAMASAFAYLLALDVGIFAAGAISYECTSVPECAILSSGTFALGTDLSAAAAFADEVTLVSGSACLSVAVFCIALATAAAWSASLWFLSLVRDLSLSSWTWGVLGLLLRVCCDTSRCHSLSAGFWITWTFSPCLRILRRFPLMVPRWFWLLRLLQGHVLLAEHRRHHGWTWT